MSPNVSSLLQKSIQISTAVDGSVQYSKLVSHSGVSSVGVSGVSSVGVSGVSSVGVSAVVCSPSPTTTVTIAVSVFPLRSHKVYSKVSIPSKSSFGV